MACVYQLAKIEAAKQGLRMQDLAARAGVSRVRFRIMCLDWEHLWERSRAKVAKGLGLSVEKVQAWADSE